MVDQAMAPTRRMKVTKYVKAVIKVPKKTPTVATKVATLVKQVKKLNKISYDRVTMVMTQGANLAVTKPYFIANLCGQMSTWAPTFGSNDADVNNADKVYINSYKWDVRLSQGSEADRIYYSYFLISLKDQANDSSTFDPATGGLQLVDGTHFRTLSTDGRVLLNPKFFNIHRYKRFTMGGRPGDQSAPETRDLSFTIVPKQKLITNPRGNVFGNAAHSFPRDPSQNYFFILFNDDSGADLQVNTISIGGLASVAVPS